MNWINSIFARDKLWKNKEDNERKVVHFFQQLYKGDNGSRPRIDEIPFSKVSSVSVSYLEARLTKEEIRETVFGHGRDRAPGPDWFPIAYFQIFWNLTEAGLRVFFSTNFTIM